MENKEQIIDLLSRINALASNPHWTSDRRWQIEQLSREALQLLRKDKQS